MEEKVVIDMRLSTKDIWKFSLYHASRGFQGVFNVLITVVSLGYLIFRWNMLAVNHRDFIVVRIALFSDSASNTLPKGCKSGEVRGH